MNVADGLLRVSALTLAIWASSLGSQLEAGIIASSGVSLLPGPPAGNVHPGTQQPTLLPLFFPEILGAAVQDPGGLPVDHDGTNLLPTLSQSSSVADLALVPAIIPLGTRFDSYLFHFDPADTTFPSDSNFYFDATVEFSTRILGVQLFTNADTSLEKPAGTGYVGTLEAGDLEIATNGGPGVAYYPSGFSFRGLEEDSLSIDLDGHRIIFAGKAFGVEIDQVRVIVAIVPEPRSLALGVTALLAMAAMLPRSCYNCS